MDKEVKETIHDAVKIIIEKSSDNKKIKKIEKKHEAKIHFVPSKYRIFGGLLQSMNIQFGNFIETLIALFVENDGRYEILKEYSGKKSNSFKLSAENDTLIDANMKMLIP